MIPIAKPIKANPGPPCEVCGSRVSGYRPYLKQAICYRCRLHPDQLVMTVNNLVKKYGVSKTVLLAARELAKTPPTRNFDWWNIDEGDKRAIAALEKRGFLLGSLLSARRLLTCHPFRKPDAEKMRELVERQSAAS